MNRHPMKKEIIEALTAKKFEITDSDDSIVKGRALSFGNGCFYISIRINDQTLSMELAERFGVTSIFLCQKFKDVDNITELLEGSYPFQELVMENDGSYEKLFKERMMTGDLLFPGETWGSRPQ